jgi:hypothetical protein
MIDALSENTAKEVPLADRPSSPDYGSGTRTSNPRTDEPPASLGAQFGRTRKALLGLIGSHVALAKAEFSEIADEIKRVAALAGGALFLLFLTAILIFVGVLLFFGELIFGSTGWGVLLGSELLIAVAAVLILAILELGWTRAGAAFVVALGIGLVVGGILAADWAAVSRNNASLPGQPWMAVVSGAVLLAFVAAVLGASFGRGVASAAAIAGILLGALLGLLASAGPGLRVAAAVGVAFLLLMWPVTAAVLLFRQGVDTEKLRKRFVPEATIETTKETIEWVREQMPLGPKS